MTFQRVLARTVTLPVPGILKVTGGVQMGTSGPSPWRYSFNLLIDGNLVWNPGGTNPQDSIPLVGVWGCAAGARTVELLWTADPGLTLYRAFLILEGLNNVHGA